MKVKNKLRESITIDLMLRSINHPLLFIDNENNIVMSNSAAEEFFGISSVILEKKKINLISFCHFLILL